MAYKKTHVQLGTRFGNLTVVGDYQDKTRMFITLCDCGQLSRKRAGNVLKERTTSCGRHGHGIGRRGMDEVPTYRTAHYMLSLTKGLASHHTCIDCPEQASDWSYTYTDPNPLYGSQAKTSTSVMAYSLNPDYYVPRCKPCHKRFDNAQKKRAA